MQTLPELAKHIGVRLGGPVQLQRRQQTDVDATLLLRGLAGEELLQQATNL